MNRDFAQHGAPVVKIDQVPVSINMNTTIQAWKRLIPFHAIYWILIAAAAVFGGVIFYQCYLNELLLRQQ